MFTPRSKPLFSAATALAAGLALSANAAAQMPSFSITNIDWLQNQGYDGRSIWIGQMESGIAAQHASYSDRIAAQDAGGAATRHATHVAGIMVSDSTEYGGQDVSGIASGSRLVSSYAQAPGNSSGHYAAGMDYLVARPIEVINISWGGTATADPNAITRAADWAAGSRGKLVVVAAGNNSTAAAAGRINYPADGYNVLTVGATGFGGGAAATPNYRRLATYSSVGPTVGATASGRSKPDLVAPGSYIFSATDLDHNGDGVLNDFHNSDFPGPAGNTRPVSGTSFAAPHVSGAAALLMESARGKAWENQAIDPLTMRAVLINGASKNVYDRANKRWDTNWQARQAAGNTSTPLDPQLGSGLLDARRSYEILQAGQQDVSSYTHGSGGGGRYGYTMPVTGWDRTSIDPGWTYQYTPSDDYRKGSYITTTLTTERATAGASAGAATYSRALGNVDLEIERFRRDANNQPLIERVARSNSTRDSVEHIVYKTTDRGSYEFNVVTASASTERYAIAWHGYAAPTQVREFNGDFMGDRGALNDNGWFDASSALASSAVTRAPFAADPTSDAAFAMQLTPTLSALTTARMAQEMVTPLQGLALSFDLGFTANFRGSMSVMLDGLNLLSLAGVAGGALSPQAGVNINQYRHYVLDLTRPGLLAGLTGAFSDLVFQSSGIGGSAFVDNVTYVPDPGPLALAALAMLIAGRRRRS